MSEREIVISIPWTPDTRCRPNAKCSERTRIHYRKMGAAAAGYPLKVLMMDIIEHEADFAFGGPVELDIEIQWERGRKEWDSDAVVSAMKYVRDALETYQIVENDRNIRIGVISQTRATDRPQTILRLRVAA